MVARNVEIKARVENPAAIRWIAVEAANGEPELLLQLDTYFNVEAGRLKLREFADGEAELIYYHRPDGGGPTESNYHRIPVGEGQALRKLLADALGIRGEVSKRRQVYRVGQTRVHLDEVRGLGNFLELEVMLEENETADAGITEAQRLIQLFGIPEDALVAESYIDLLTEESENSMTGPWKGSRL